SARSSFEQWVRRAPDSPTARFHLAEAQAMAGEPALARASLEQAIELAPGYVDARLGLVRLLTRMTELQAANEQVTRLLAEHGQRRDVLATAGWFQVLTGQFAEGEKQLGRAIEIAEDS
ncbi:tetratricopeptide repeat protein, partial [Arthrospira platensis SPKY1]|nr:tetratricopeptide repeat protein [Arthrospira platensis SPKY1]